MTKKTKFISVLIVLDKNETNLSINLRNLFNFLENNYYNFEIVIADNNYGNKNRDKIKELIYDCNSIKYFKIVSIFDENIGLSVGLQNVIGDLIIFFKLDRDPVETINLLVDEAEDNSNIVFAKNIRKKSFKRIIINPLLALILKLVKYKLPSNLTSLMCINRTILNNFPDIKITDENLFIQLLLFNSKAKIITYKTLSEYSDKRTLKDNFLKFKKIISFTSLQSFKLLSYLGLLGSFISLVIGIYTIVINFIKTDVIEGWTTIIIFQSSLFFMLFLVLSILSEYIANFIKQSSRNKNFMITEEISSPTLLNDERMNIISKEFE